MTGFDGTWDVTLHAPQGATAVTLDFDAKSGTGVMTQPGAASGPLEDLTFEGDAATWRAKVAEPMPLVVDFSATVDGDQINGVAAVQSFIKIPFDGARR